MDPINGKLHGDFSPAHFQVVMNTSCTKRDKVSSGRILVPFPRHLMTENTSMEEALLSYLYLLEQVQQIFH